MSIIFIEYNGILDISWYEWCIILFLPIFVTFITSKAILPIIILLGMIFSFYSRYYVVLSTVLVICATCLLGFQTLSDLSMVYNDGSYNFTCHHKKYGKIIFCDSKSAFNFKISKCALYEAQGVLSITNNGIEFVGLYNDAIVNYKNNPDHNLVIVSNTPDKKYTFLYKNGMCKMQCEYFSPGLRNFNLYFSKEKKYFSGKFYNIDFTGTIDANLCGNIYSDSFEPIRFHFHDKIIHLNSPNITGSVDIKKEIANILVYDHYIKVKQNRLDIMGPKISMSINANPDLIISGPSFLYKQSLLDNIYTGSSASKITILCDNFQQIDNTLRMYQTKNCLDLSIKNPRGILRVKQSPKKLYVDCSNIASFYHLVPDFIVIAGKLRMRGIKKQEWSGIVDISNARLSPDSQPDNASLLWHIKGYWNWNGSTLSFHDLKVRNNDAEIIIHGSFHNGHLQCHGSYLNFNTIAQILSVFTSAHILGSRFYIGGLIGQVEYTINKFTAIYGWIAHLPI